MNRSLLASLTAAALSIVAPAAAHAGVAGEAFGEFDGLIFSAQPGEANQVTVSRQGNDLVVEDAGATIEPHRSCTADTPNRVRCEGTDTVIVRLGDGNDRATVADQVTPAAERVYLFGEQGDDELVGSAVQNGLSAGPGRDTLRGGTGTESYSAVDFLAFGGLNSQPRVRVEPDRVVCAPFAGPGTTSVDADAQDTLDGPCPQATLRSDPRPGPRPAQKPGRCKRASTARGTRRVVRTKYAVVFTRRTGGYYACLYSQGRISKLRDEGAGLNGRPKPVLKGRFVGYTTRGSAIGDEFDRVVVWDMRNARIVSQANSTFVRRIVMKSNGSIAWIARSEVTTTNLNRPLWEVRQMSAVDRQGDVLVGRGGDVDPASLRLWRNDRTISWNRGGQTRSAALQ